MVGLWLVGRTKRDCFDCLKFFRVDCNWQAGADAFPASKDSEGDGVGEDYGGGEFIPNGFANQEHGDLIGAFLVTVVPLVQCGGGRATARRTV